VTAVVDLGVRRNASERPHTSAALIGDKLVKATQPDEVAKPARDILELTRFGGHLST
jgi:hypothetical protein